MQGPGPGFTSVSPPGHGHRGPICLGPSHLPSTASALPCPGCRGFEDTDGQKVKTQQRATRRRAGRPVLEADSAPGVGSAPGGGLRPRGWAPCDGPPPQTLQAQQRVSCEQPRHPEPLSGSRQGAVDGGKRASASASASKRLASSSGAGAGGEALRPPRRLIPTGQPHPGACTAPPCALGLHDPHPRITGPT